ncbi:MAG: (d)CMP kinase [Gemmatimonadota bacterium]
MIIAIDGTAGSGKSTTAQEVARRLGFLHLDSGALYRAFGVAAGRHGWASPAGVVPAERIPELAAQNVAAEVEAGGAGGAGGVVVVLDGRRLNEELRSPAVSACASKVSVFPVIRRRVDEILRRLAADYAGGIVCEGRDMGTVVFPEAELKVFMQAEPEERAQRRLLQRGERVTRQRVRAERRRLVARDAADSGRDVSPLRRAEDAMVIDTTHLSFEEQVERVVAAAARLLDTA